MENEKYFDLVKAWLDAGAPHLTGAAKDLAVDVVLGVVNKARDGDISAVEWLRERGYLTPQLPPQINVQFGRPTDGNEQTSDS